MKLFSVKIFKMRSDMIEEIKKPKIYHQRVRRCSGLFNKALESGYTQGEIECFPVLSCVIVCIIVNK